MEHEDLELAALGQRNVATDRIGRGFAFILLAPLVFFMSIALGMLLDSLVPFLIGLVGATSSGIAGAILCVQGIVQHLSASRDLRRLGDARRLPAARLLPHGHARR